MLTKLTIRNFKRFAEVEIELGSPVVFVGPNNSGKTTALQALALWEAGVRRWTEKRSEKGTPEKRPGVAINRRDLVAVPVPTANLLWKDLHVRDVGLAEGKPKTQNVRVEVVVEGVTDGRAWECGLEFDYANEESFYCRPLRSGSEPTQRMPVPDDARQVRVAFLPPMSGLADREFVKQPGEVSFLIGQGRTAEVLRNLCHQLVTNGEGQESWQRICSRVADLFGVKLEEPAIIAERAEIVMSARNPQGVRLDLSSEGRGLHQTLLLLAYLAVNRRSVLLLDEPDAHLEILRQRHIYQLLTESAREHGSQIIAASHSEVILNEAADRDVVVAFVGRPHRIDDRGSQLMKSLKEIGFDQYYQAEQTGWVLYLEGPTDLAILTAFAVILEHRAQALLERPFVHYVMNQPSKAREHFRGLREAKPDLVGIAIFDRLEKVPLQDRPELREVMWRRREIENYLCSPTTLLAFAEESAEEAVPGPLFERAERDRRRAAMEECIADFVPPVSLRDPSDPWWTNVKASDEFLDRVFAAFFKKLGLPNLMSKTDYHALARHVKRAEIAPEVSETLDAIVKTAAQARPAT